MADIEKLVEQRYKKNENYQYREDLKDVHPRFKLNSKLSDYPTEEIESLSEKQLEKLQNKIKGLNDKDTTLNLWEKFVSMPDWDKISNEELQKSYILGSDAKKCNKNFKQEHFFVDFLHYKNTTEMPESLNYIGRRNNILCKTFKKKCDMWNILYDNNKKLKKLINKFLKKYHKQFLNLSFQQRFLEYSGGDDYGKKCTLNDKYCQFRMSGVRIRKGTTFPTLVKSGPMPILINERRYLTNREGARLQSFPADFEFVGGDTNAMRRIGNAVNVQVIELMMRGALRQIFPESFGITYENQNNELGLSDEELNVNFEEISNQDDEVEDISEEDPTTEEEIAEDEVICDIIEKTSIVDNICKFILTRGKNKGKECGKKNCKSKSHKNKLI